MNVDMYCKVGKDGNFCLLFPNTNALSIDEIRSIFSEFGNVQSIKCAGDERGIRFVSYKNKIEAINSIMSLKGHESIDLMAWKNKDGIDLKSQNQYKGQSSRLARVNDHEHSSEQSRRNRQFYSTNSNGMPLDKTESTGGKSNGVNNSYNFNQSRDNKYVSNSLSQSAHKDIQSDSQDIQGIENEKYGNNSGVKSVHKIMNCLSHQSAIKKGLLNEESEKSKDKLITSTDKKNSVTESKELNDDDIPELIPTEEVTQKLKNCNGYSKNYASMLRKIKIVVAGEVIVANISKPFGTAYILHLFESFHPLCISNIMTSAQSIRYCYVYFRTPLEASKIEKKFDRFSLRDNNLIVLRPEKLASEVQRLKPGVVSDVL